MSSHRILACAMLLLLQVSHGFLKPTKLRALHTTQEQKHTSSSQLSMAWTLPNQPSFQPTWYQEVGNPTRREVVYDDMIDDDEEFYVSSFRTLSFDTTEPPMVPEQEVLPRAARIGRAARRAFKGLRNSLRP